MKKCEEVFEFLDVEKTSIVHVQRMGKIRKDSKRILKINCNSVQTVKKLLMKARRLNTTENFKTVYIGKDLTRLQQNEERVLREELKRRRALGENVVIYRGSICNKNEIGKNFQ